MIKRLFCCVLPLCLLFACTGAGGDQPRDSKQDPAANAAKNPAPGGDKPTSNDSPEGDFKITLIDEETGERREVDGEIVVEEGERFTFYPAKDSSAASYENLDIVGSDGKKAEIPLGKVTILEYWSSDTMARNQYWNKMRELEREYQGSEEIQFISIYYDTTLRGEPQIAAAGEFLKNYSQPGLLLYDLDDGFRDKFWMPGPICYYLVDHRGQLVRAGRADSPETQTVFDGIKDALLHQDAAKNGSIRIEPVKE